MLITLLTNKTMSESAAALQAAVEANHFVVMQMQNLAETMTLRGVKFAHECLIFEVCQLQQTKKILEENMSVSTALPCRISIYEENGKTVLAALKPTSLLAMFNTPQLREVAQEVENMIIKIMKEASEVDRMIEQFSPKIKSPAQRKYSDPQLKKHDINNVVAWMLQIMAALAFLIAGFAKLLGHPMAIETFDQIGFGQWFRYMTGVIEVGSALLLLIPKWDLVGALLLVATMIGAALTHLFIIGGSAVPALALLVLVSSIVWARHLRLQPFLDQFFSINEKSS